jgi:threonine/homoserine/homoserine lactone efflux protein
MEIGHLAAFLGVSLLVIVTPGQDTALTVRNTLLGGRRGGVFTALGVVSGQLAWAFATSAGLAAVVLASQPAFTAIKLAGAAYLVVLGAQALAAAARNRPSTPPAESRQGRRTARTAYRQGALSNLGNPKMAVYFTSLLPQFVSSFGAMVALGLVFASITLAWLAAYAVTVAKAQNVLRRTGVRRLVDTITGLVLVSFGLRLAVER